MAHYNLRTRPSAVAATGPVTDTTGLVTDIIVLAILTVIQAACFETEPSDVRLVGSGETNLESGDDVNINVSEATNIILSSSITSSLTIHSPTSKNVVSYMYK